MTHQIKSAPKRNKPVGIILTALYFAIGKGLLSLIVSILYLFISGLPSMPVWVALIGVVW